MGNSVPGSAEGPVRFVAPIFPSCVIFFSDHSVLGVQALRMWRLGFTIGPRQHEKGQRNKGIEEISKSERCDGPGNLS